MTSEGEKCGLTSLLPMSCRGRAVAFAKSLHSRLTSLNSENDSADESSWLTDTDSHIATSQPRHVLDFSHLESPGSPDEELDELHKLINGDLLQPCQCSRTFKSSSDSDSDVYYDIDSETDLEKRLVNGNTKKPCCCQNNEVFTTMESRNGGASLEAVKEQERMSHYCRNEVVLTAEGLSNGGICIESEKVYDCLPQSPVSKEIPITTELNGDLKIAKPEVTKNESTFNSLTTQDSQESAYSSTEDLAKELTNGTGSSSESSSKSEETFIEDGSTTQEEFYSTTSDLSSLSLCEEAVALSLREKDCDLLKCNGETNQCDKQIEVYRSHLDVDNKCILELSPQKLETSEKQVEVEEVEEIEEDNNEEVEPGRIPRVRRSTSLKTGKTPPGTPGRKKIVRFADALGLDLADVRTFLDEIPKIPVSAYEDLSVDPSDPSSTASQGVNPAYHGLKADKILMPLFQQPGGEANFLDLVKDNLVCLENALVDDPFILSIKGMVRVRNLDFHKSVHIRYSLNQWKSFADVQATYLVNSCDGFSDKFSFVIYAHTLSVGQRIEFACRFQCKGCQYWDNNKGKNYVFQCLPSMNNASMSPIMHTDDWGASFYYKDTTSTTNESSPDSTTSQIQDYILDVLDSKTTKATPYHRQTDAFTVFAILMFSFLLLYLQKAIYFTK